MMTLFYVLLGLFVFVLVNRAAMYYYFNSDKFTEYEPNELQDNNFRNAHERSGITPGGVSWIPTEEYIYKKNWRQSSAE
jgi:hypothetical protein